MPVELVLSEFSRIAPFIYKLGNLTTKPDISASAALVQRMIVTELRDEGHPIQIELKLDSQQVEWTASIPNPVISVDSATQTTSNDWDETDQENKSQVGLELLVPGTAGTSENVGGMIDNVGSSPLNGSRHLIV